MRTTGERAFSCLRLATGNLVLNPLQLHAGVRILLPSTLESEILKGNTSQEKSTASGIQPSPFTSI